MNILELLLKRQHWTQGYTHGCLYILDKNHNQNFICYTLEDQERPEKIPKETAIPIGRYEVVYTLSRRFGIFMPELLNVPNFTGIRIHAGNTIEDTEGCILVGFEPRDQGKLYKSLTAFNIVSRLVEAATKKGKVFLEIV